ncbi:MAG: domain S-box, partial [Solirubrobacterales bacterium]|nr:domain S-box [Solirubrobacterales bacterium]
MKRGRDVGLSSAAGAELSGESLVSTMPGAFLMLDRKWTVIHVNQHTQWLLGKNAEDLLGRNVWEVFPEAVGSTFQRQYEAAIREQRPMRFREYFAPVRHWFDVRACPVPGGGLAIYFDEVDEVQRV